MLLNQTEIKWIEKKALDVISESYGSLNSVSVPIDVFKIATHLGLSIQSGTIDKPEVSAIYVKDDKRIITQKTDPYTRKIFSIAHEIGHFILHSNKKDEVFYRTEAVNLDQASQKDEQEANAFAASLLMPEFLVRQLWKQFPDTLIVASNFGVSHVGAYYRLKNLGLVT